MSRTVDLLSYLPPYPNGFREMRAAMASETPLIQEALDESGAFLDNQYILSCGEKGIARYENMLRLYPDAQDTLERRILRVYVKWTDYLPYTRRALEGRLSALCGADGYELSIDYARRSLEINLLQKALDYWEAVLVMLRQMIPANMGIVRSSTMDELVCPVYFTGAAPLSYAQTVLPEYKLTYDFHANEEIKAAAANIAYTVMPPLAANREG